MDGVVEQLPVAEECSPALVTSDSTRPQGPEPRLRGRRQFAATGPARPLSSTSTRGVAEPSLGDGMPVIGFIGGIMTTFPALAPARGVRLVGVAEPEAIADDDIRMKLPARQIDGKALHVLKRCHPRGADCELFVQQQVRHLGVQPAPSPTRETLPTPPPGNGCRTSLSTTGALDDPRASLADCHFLYRRIDIVVAGRTASKRPSPSAHFVVAAGLHAVDIASAQSPPIIAAARPTGPRPTTSRSSAPLVPMRRRP